MTERPQHGVTVEPFDQHNQRLVENVHPPGWRNPTPKDRYHLVVIGAGAAGLVSAVGSAGLGARVALVERHLLGGDCLNVGCVPSKAVIRAARAWHDARDGGAFGAPRAGTEGGDFATAMERMRRVRAQISPIDSAVRLTSVGVDVFLGHGRFTGRDSVEVDGAALRFRRAVIATGARAAAPPIPGLEPAGYRTNENIFALTELPPRLAVIGAGPIGCELAQAFARFGARVTLFDVAPQILIREDADAARIVADALVRDGVELAVGVKMIEVRRAGATGGERTIAWERGGERGETVCDEILVAVGRAPNVEDLGLEAAGVAYDKTGVMVDQRLRTTNPRIFAAGDITPLLKFTHLADAHAAMVIQNAFFFGRARHQNLVVPWVTYTSPEIAHVGRYEKEAQAAGLETQSITVPLGEVDRAVLDGAGEGFLRVVVEAGKDRILGATLVAEHAGDMISEICLAITHGIGLGKIATTIHPYPTQSEVFRKAANQWRRGRLTPTVKKIFDLWFRALR
jgi:pyruvate/2-oxoglutarate dehydrogenase complex dihydrolipoamide dehydrogenase (E3) component